ncbi:MAG: S1/P1 nuclease [Pseudomonadota bacterium]
MSLIRIIFAAVLLLVAPLAGAWTMHGHRAIADLVWLKLSPAARDAAWRILQTHPDFQRGLADQVPENSAEWSLPRLIFRESAAWPDTVRSYRDTDPAAWSRYHRGNWHWFNDLVWVSAEAEQALISRVEIDRAEDLPSMGEEPRNAVQAIKWTTAILGDPTVADEEQALALAWLLHVGADIHNPVHAVSLFGLPALGNEGDRGGNRICLDDLENWNLHSFWDLQIAGSRGEVDIDARGLLLARELTDEVAAMPIGDGSLWWRESVELARSVVYPQWLRLQAAARIDSDRCDVTSGRIRLSAAYREEARVVAMAQGAKSAVRLAAVLEDVLVSR